MDPSPSVEADVRSWAEKLEEYSHRITSCRVTIEAPHRHHHNGRLYRVRVELGVPGRRIVAARSPMEHHEHEDVYVAIRDAFRAARRRLEDHVRRRRGQVKSRVEPPHGRVVHLEADFEYGRIATDDGREIYFHRNSVLGGIERLRVGNEVRYHEETGIEGPQASSVEPIGAHGRHEPTEA